MVDPPCRRGTVVKQITEPDTQVAVRRGIHHHARAPADGAAPIIRSTGGPTSHTGCSHISHSRWLFGPLTADPRQHECRARRRLRRETSRREFRLRRRNLPRQEMNPEPVLGALHPARKTSGPDDPVVASPNSSRGGVPVRLRMHCPLGALFPCVGGLAHVPDPCAPGFLGKGPASARRSVAGSGSPCWVWCLERMTRGRHASAVCSATSAA
jgi:hypothetical protein